MFCFQALTNAVLNAELDLLRVRFGLEPNQKAELLREIAAIAGWVARQAELGGASKRTVTVKASGWCIRPWSNCEPRWSDRSAHGWR